MGNVSNTAIRDHNLERFAVCGMQIDVENTTLATSLGIFWRGLRRHIDACHEMPAGSEATLPTLAHATMRAVQAATRRTPRTDMPRAGDGDGAARLERWLGPVQDFVCWGGRFASQRAKFWATTHPRADAGVHFGHADRRTGRIWLYCGTDDWTNLALLVHEVTHLGADQLAEADHALHRLPFRHHEAVALYELVERYDDPLLALTEEDGRAVIGEMLAARKAAMALT